MIPFHHQKYPEQVNIYHVKIAISYHIQLYTLFVRNFFTRNLVLEQSQMAKKLSVPKLQRLRSLWYFSLILLYNFEDTVWRSLKKKHVQKTYKQNCKHSIFSEWCFIQVQSLQFTCSQELIVVLYFKKNVKKLWELKITKREETLSTEVRTMFLIKKPVYHAYCLTVVKFSDYILR